MFENRAFLKVLANFSHYQSVFQKSNARNKTNFFFIEIPFYKKKAFNWNLDERIEPCSFE